MQSKLEKFGFIYCVRPSCASVPQLSSAELVRIPECAGGFKNAEH